MEKLDPFDLDTKDIGFKSQNTVVLITERNLTALWKKQNEIIDAINGGA
jgi:hypothetical protein